MVTKYATCSVTDCSYPSPRDASQETWHKPRTFCQAYTILKACPSSAFDSMDCVYLLIVYTFR